MRAEELSSGDVFSIPMNDGRVAISQIIWMPLAKSSARFRNVFSFAVISVQHDEVIPIGNDFFTFSNYRGEFKVIFTSKEKLINGAWVLLRGGDLNEAHEGLKYFNNAGGLYYLGEYIRTLDVSEYKDYNIMAVAGYELIQQYLLQCQ